MDINKMKFFESLSEETREKLRKCKTTEDYIALAEEENVELTDEQLDMISGGEVWDNCYACSGDFYRE